MSAILNNFPGGTRGTYRLNHEYGSDEQFKTAGEQLAFAKKLVNDAARVAQKTVLLDVKIYGSGWILIWWPASEPRHSQDQEILTGDENYGKTH